MKILLTGGGSGGHFYPIIAVAQSLRKIAEEKKLIDVRLYYMAPQPYDERMLFENNITFIKGSAGKMRRYFSILNFFDIFRTFFGTMGAIWRIYWLYPDVIFSKGGYVSFPAMFAAWFLWIPVVIHESDSHPGRVNIWSGKFARKIAISYPEAASFFPKDRVALTGNPVRKEIMHLAIEGAHEFLHLEKNIPVLLILGGSQGSQIINQMILDILPKLVEKYQIIHQVGRNNFNFVKSNAAAILLTNPNKSHYQPFESLNSLALRMAAGAADLIISRAGSTIFEIAIWNLPSILIPITDSNGDHQRKNAYSYARTGATIVIEESNLSPHLLQGEIDRLMENPDERAKMCLAARSFARLDAGYLIAEELVSIGMEHER